MSFRPEQNDGSGWARNALVFSTHDEALESARELFGRWFGSREYRVVEGDWPVTHQWIDTRGNVRLNALGDVADPYAGARCHYCTGLCRTPASVTYGVCRNHWHSRHLRCDVADCLIHPTLTSAREEDA